MRLIPARPHPQKTALIWHYTNASGFVGIVGHNALWATHGDYLNDASELRHGQAMVQRMYDSPITPAPDEMGYDLSGNDLARLGQSVQGGVTVCRKGPAPYVTCFSEARDVLSQWRGYGGLGYALGFRMKDLDQFAGSLDGRMLTVNYLEDGEDPGVPSVTYEDSRTVVELSPLQQAYFKHPGFTEEAEVRLVVPQGGATLPDPNFRESNLGLVPYLSLPMAPTQLQPVEVIVGPGPNSDLRQQSARQLLDVHHWNTTTVRPSRIPFRG